LHANSESVGTPHILRNMPVQVTTLQSCLAANGTLQQVYANSLVLDMVAGHEVPDLSACYHQHLGRRGGGHAHGINRALPYAITRRAWRRRDYDRRLR
jgi:hypothetical protein